MPIVGFFVILYFMKKKSRNFKKWERFLKKDKDLSQDVDIEFCAQLLANQEKFEKTILDVAKEILKNAGYLVENDNQDIPEKYSNDVYNNIYAEFSNKDEFQQFYNENKEKIDDYTKFGWKMHYTAEFVAKSIIDDLYLDY